jgi:hypothetical protein
MLKSVCVLFSVLFVAPLATADVFKCVGKSGEDLYQNFPCQFESIGATPGDGTSVGGTPKGGTPTGETSINAHGQKKSPTAPAEPRVGMTTDEVRAIWGEPTDTVQEEPGDGPRFEVWSYGDSRSVRFDRRGRVTAVTL